MDSVNGKSIPQTEIRVRVGYLAGASAQLELRHGLRAAETEAIYKPLRDSFGEGSGYTVLTWDFPVPLKYHVARLGRAPFVEAGPSFRLSCNLNGYNPSHIGAIVGVGGRRPRAGQLYPQRYATPVGPRIRTPTGWSPACTPIIPARMPMPWK